MNSPLVQKHLHARNSVGIRTSAHVDLGSISTEHPVLHIPEFLDPDLAHRTATAFAELSLTPYQVTVDAERGAAFFYGANLYDARPDPSASTSGDPYEAYFNNAAADRRRFDELLARKGLPHPLHDILIPTIERSLRRPVSIASEGDGRTYYTPVVRNTTNGLHHHNDDGPRESPELIIGKVRSQRSMLLFLDVPSDGSGASEVFHKQPTDEDRELHARKPYGYTTDAVDGIASTTVVPGVGDLFVFDAWNIHRVQPSTPDTPRVTVSTFYGELPDGSLIIWS